ncbi:unnamed protein product [Withania somnifera]
MILVLKSLILFFVVFVSCNGDDRKIYLVLLEGDPVAFRQVKTFSEEGNKLGPNSEASKAYANELTKSHDEFLQSHLETGSYDKIYSFKHIVNGVAVHTTPSQWILVRTFTYEDKEIRVKERDERHRQDIYHRNTKEEFEENIDEPIDRHFLDFNYDEEVVDSLVQEFSPTYLSFKNPLTHDIENFFDKQDLSRTLPTTKKGKNRSI